MLDFASPEIFNIKMEILLVFQGFNKFFNILK
jgi:hypothetical protein